MRLPPLDRSILLARNFISFSVNVAQFQTNELWAIDESRAKMRIDMTVHRRQIEQCLFLNFAKPRRLMAVNLSFVES